MGRVRSQRKVRERLLLDPGAGAVKREKKAVARRRRVVDRDQPGDPSTFVGVDRTPQTRKAVVGLDVHVPGRDRDARATREAAQDQDPTAVEVTEVAHRRADDGAHAQERDNRPARLPSRKDDELPAGVGSIDVVEERGLPLDEGDAIDREVDQLSTAQLPQRERRGIAEHGVARDVIEGLSAAAVDQRTEGVDEDARVIAAQAPRLQRHGDGVVGASRSMRGDIGLDGRIVREQGRAEALRPLAAERERLAVPEDARREVRDPDGLLQLEQRPQRGDDIDDDAGGMGSAALPGELPGITRGGGDGGALGGQKRPGDRMGRRRKRSERGDQRVAQSEALGLEIAGSAIERGVEQALEVDRRGEPREIDARSALLSDSDGPRREQVPQHGDGTVVSLDGERARHSPVALSPIEDRAERGAHERRGGDVSANGQGRVHSEDDSARRLLATDPETRAEAFASGCAPVLARGLGARVASVLTTERTPWYLTILYALLLFRRDHEIEPLHEDVWARVAGPVEHMGPYDGPTFAQDLDQLVAWGAVDRITEAHKLRSYRDNRRERFRYRLTEDAVALLEWLEARLAAKLAGRVGDSRDRLQDVLGHARELRRVLDEWRSSERDAATTADLARRALYLLEAVGEAIDEIGTELLMFRAEMLAFASRPYDLKTLREILTWLERYVAVYVRRIEELRGEVETRFRELRAPRYREAIDECRHQVAEERAALPRALRGAAVIAVPSGRIDAHAAFFAVRGGLAGMCARIDESARAVVVKMQRHVRELERRSERLGDLRAAIRAIAGGPERDVRYAELTGAMIAAAHVRLDRSPAAASRREPPPMPRAHVRNTTPTATRPLARKRGGLEAVRELAARRRAQLGRWLDELLGEDERVQLSARPPAGAGAVRGWIDVARARHLGNGRMLEEIGIALVPADGQAAIADEQGTLTAPDCWIERRKS